MAQLKTTNVHGDLHVSGDITQSGNKVYHEGYKPTKEDVGLGNVDNVQQAPITREIATGTGLSGGGTLESDLTLSVTYGTTAGTATQGNDARLSNSREWTASTIAQAEAETGTATTRRAWTAQRVRQAIVSWWDSSTFKTKLDGVETGATANSTDAQLRDRATHTGVQPISSVSGLQTALDSKADTVDINTQLNDKVDKVDGKQLSDANFTQAEKDKLSSLESSKFVGLFVSESALPLSGSEGDYANVDGGVGSDVYRVIWDSSDNKWVRVQGVSTELTDAQIKQQYESNPDTNAFTNNEKSKLSGIDSEATKNRADSLNADKVHTHTMNQVTGLDDALDNKASKTELTNGLELKVDKETGKGLIEPAPIDGKQYARKDNTWVEVTGGDGGGTGDVEEAPVDGKTYARKDSAWVNVSDEIDAHAESATDALLRLQIHQNDPTLNIIGYASPRTPTPPSPSELDAWLVTETGTVFGVHATIGNAIYYDGSKFVRTYLNRTYFRPSIYAWPMHGYILEIDYPYTYLKVDDKITLRGDYFDLDIKWDIITSDYPELIGTSPMGETGCLIIENGYAFVFNTRSSKIEVLWYKDVLPHHIVLIRYLNKEISGVFSDNETRLTAQELRGNLRMRWQLGGVSTSNGQPSSLTTSLRTTMFEPKGDIQVVFNKLTDYRYRVVYYDENGDLVKTTGWLTIDKFTIPYVSGQRLRFLLAKNNNSDLELWDRDWLDVIEIKDWSDIISDNSSDNESKLAAKLHWGNGSVSPNTGLETALSTRIRSNFVSASSDIEVVISPTSLYKYYVIYYDENLNVTGDSGWLTSGSAINGSAYCRFLIAKVNDSNISVEDVPDSGITFYKVDKEVNLGENKNPRYISPLFSKPNSIREPKLYHHRAHQSVAPENSLPAMIASGESGVWGIETDVMVTADGVLVCHHDETINRMTDGTGRLADKTYSQLMEATIDTGANVGDFTSDDLKIPTFREYLDICRYYGIVPFIEIKVDGIIEPVVEMLKEFGMEEFSIISSFNLYHLVQTRNLSDRIFVHHILPSTSEYDTLISLGNSGVSIDYPDPSTVPDGLIDEIHKMGLKVCLRAADINAHAIKMIEIGVDYMPTNTLVSLSE